VSTITSEWASLFIRFSHGTAKITSFCIPLFYIVFSGSPAFAEDDGGGRNAINRGAQMDVLIMKRDINSDGLQSSFSLKIDT